MGLFVGCWPLRFPIGCFVNKINKVLSLVVHARRYCLNSFYHLLACENEFDIQLKLEGGWLFFVEHLPCLVSSSACSEVMWRFNQEQPIMS